jgi:hypothetical protein
MDQHLSRQDLKDLADRRMEIERLLMSEEHLADCPVCRASFAAHRRAISPAVIAAILMTDAAEAEHLTYEMLESYVDGRSNEVDREIVNTHNAACRSCADELAEMFVLKGRMAPVGHLHSAAVPKGAAGWRNILASGSWLKIAVPAFGFVLIGFIIWGLWQRPVIDQTARVNSPTAGSEMPVNEVATITDPGINEPSNIVTTEPANVSDEVNAPVISLADGGNNIEIDAAGNLTGVDAPRFASRVRAALTKQSIDIPSTAKELRSKSGVLMSGDQSGVSFALIAPVGKIVESTRPPFRWKPLAGADSYVVRVFDSGFNKVDESPPLRQTTWKPSAQLKAGTIYQWQVTASKNGEEIVSPARPAPDARFKVLDAAAANEIAAAKRSHGKSHLILGIAYANAGLVDEAAREFQALLNQNPRSEIAKRLLQRVKAAR